MDAKRLPHLNGFAGRLHVLVKALLGFQFQHEFTGTLLASRRVFIDYAAENLLRHFLACIQGREVGVFTFETSKRLDCLLDHTTVYVGKYLTGVGLVREYQSVAFLALNALVRLVEFLTKLHLLREAYVLVEDECGCTFRTGHGIHVVEAIFNEVCIIDSHTCLVLQVVPRVTLPALIEGEIVLAVGDELIKQLAFFSVVYQEVIVFTQ